jgi:hypothetical protein
MYWSWTMKFTVRHLAVAAVLGAFAIGIAVVVWRSAWNYAGYCGSQKRFLPNEERIAVAIDYILQTYPPSIRVPPGSQNVERPTRAVPYSGADDFRARNPSCCEIVERLPEGYAPGLGARIQAQFVSFVRLNFRVRYRTDAGLEEEQVVERYVAISNCGRPWSGI